MHLCRAEEEWERQDVLETMRKLIKLGMDPNVRDAAWRTPLHLAIVDESFPQAGVLAIKNAGGSDPRKRNPGSAQTLQVLFSSLVQTDETRYVCYLRNFPSKQLTRTSVSRKVQVEFCKTQKHVFHILISETLDIIFKDAEERSK